jgi:hypothetical protein
VKVDQDTSPDFRFLMSPPPVAPTKEQNESFSSSDEEEHGDLESRGVAKWLQRLGLTGPGGYQGKSSSVHLVKNALRVRSTNLSQESEYAGFGAELHKNRRPEMWTTFPVSDSLLPVKL